MCVTATINLNRFHRADFLDGSFYSVPNNAEKFTKIEHSKKANPRSKSRLHMWTSFNKERHVMETATEIIFCTAASIVCTSY